MCDRFTSYPGIAYNQGFTQGIFETGRDGIVLTCLAGGKLATGRNLDRKTRKLYPVVGWTGRNET